MTTNVPTLIFGPSGAVAPTEAEILAGRQQDLDTAFGGDLSADLRTPQGQIAVSDTAIIADAQAQMLAVFNGADPEVADGRMQDALLRIYFLTRIPATPTTAVGRCLGLVGTLIPAGTQASDATGNIYASTADETIGAGGYVDVTFACLKTGPIPCPAGALNQPYQSIAGWDSVSNAADGVLGRDVESRADCEYRRRQSVAANAHGSTESIQGAVLSVPLVQDALTLDNPDGDPNGAEFTASVAGTVMTVASMAYGTIEVGHMVTGTGVAAGTVVSSFGSGTGGAGTYNLNIGQTLSSRTLDTTQFGVVLKPHSLYVAASGGDAQAIARAIFSKKSAGCGYTGSTTVMVEDTASGYAPPYPQYEVTFRIPDPTALRFAVTMRSGAGAPSNGAVLIQQAIIGAVNGTDGGPRARIGSAVFASRFYSAVAALGTWAQIYSIKLGITAATLDSIRFRGDQAPTISAGDIAVTFVA